MAFVDPDDLSSNPSGNRPFSDVVLSRRGLMRGGTAIAAAAFIGLDATAASAQHPGKKLLGFQAVPAGSADAVVVPEGYRADVLIPWGTPLKSNGPRWHKDGSNTAAQQAVQIGFNHDGMSFFPTHGRSRGLLAVNHEYTDAAMIYPDGDAVMTREKVDKALAGHGVSVVQVAKVNGEWRLVDSRFNRRVTGTTPVAFSGPVSPGHPALAAANPPMGTLNNCSSGSTPWGTYVVRRRTSTATSARPTRLGRQARNRHAMEFHDQDLGTGGTKPTRASMLP